MSKGVSAESLRVTEVSNPGSRKTSIPKDPNNINPYGESAPQKNVSGEKDEKKADPNNPKQSQAGKGSGLGLLSAIPAIAATPPPPANILKVDTSGLHDMFVAVLSRLDGHDSQMTLTAKAVEKVNSESQSKVASLEEKMMVQASSLEVLKAQLAKEAEARMVMEAKIDLATGQQQNIEETEFGEMLLNRVSAIEATHTEHAAATATLVAELKEAQNALQAELLACMRGADEARKEQVDNLALIHQRIAKIELSITTRIGSLVEGGETETKRSGWKKKRTTLMMIARGAAQKNADLKRQEAELKAAMEKQAAELEEAEKQKLNEHVDSLNAALDVLRKDMLEEQAKMKAAQEEDKDDDPDDAYGGPSLIEMITGIKSKLQEADVKMIEDLKKLGEDVTQVTAQTEQSNVKIGELEEKLKKQQSRASKREKQPKSPTAEGTADPEALAAIEERIGQIEEDFEGEVGALQDDMDAKLDTDLYRKNKRRLDEWREETDSVLKSMAEGMARAQEFADMMADRDDEEKDAKYDDTKVLNLVSTNRADLDRQKFDREEAYVLEQELSGHLSTMREELDKHKGILHILESDNNNVDQAAMDALAAAMKAKMMAMGNAFHKRFEDLEEQLLGVGSAGSTSNINLCLSCSRPTATVDHAVRPASPMGSKAPRPSSRGGTGQRYFHKAALYSNTFDGTESALLAASNTHSHPSHGEPNLLSRPRTHHGERPGGLEPLGRPMDKNQLNQMADGNTFNLSGISTASPILDAPFRGSGRASRRN